MRSVLIYKKFFPIIVLVFVIGSCTVKENLYGVLTTDSYVQTEADIPFVVNGVYAAYQDYSLYKSSAHSMLLYSADEFSSTLVSTGFSQGLFLIRGETSADPYIRTSWQYFYSAVDRANSAINAISQAPLVSDATKKRVIGELKFMRGFTYFNLVRLFGGVPIRTVATTPNENFYLPRQSVDSVYKQIFVDLNTAANDCIPYSQQPSSESGRATKGAAQALLSLVYLTYGNYCDLNNRSSDAPNYYIKANDYADSVINSNQYSLLSNYANLFDVNNEKAAYNEVIFGIQQTRDANTSGPGSKGSELAFYLSTSNLPNICGSKPYGKGNGTLRVQPWFYNLYVSGDYIDNGVQDYRTSFNFLTNYYGTTGNQTFQHYVTYPVIIPDSANTTRESQPYFNKYRDPKGLDNRNNENDEYILRLAEVYLIKAEALNELGRQAEAILSFNAVRQRARLADGNFRTAPKDLAIGLSKEDFRMAVYNERGLELLGEFSRWFDGVRMQYGNSNKCMLQWRFETFYPGLTSTQRTLPTWNSATKSWTGGVVQPISVSTWNDRYKLFPIPATELTSNANFGNQNAGW